MLTVDYNGIPDELKAINQWIVWNDKKPYDAKTGYGPIDATNPNNGTSFYTAKVRYERDGYGGLGFILNQDLGLTVVDLDHMTTNEYGTPTNEAFEIIKRLNSYIELSPSGKGYHIWVYGNAHKPGKPVELFNNKHYVTVTGRVWGNYSNIKSNQQELDRLHNAYSKPKPIALHTDVLLRPGKRSKLYPRRTDREVRAWIENRGNARVKALWYGADYYDLGYESQSEADMALMRYIWYISNEHEPAQIERVFKESDLYREDKWNEEIWDKGISYGWYTIRKVVHG